MKKITPEQQDTLNITKLAKQALSDSNKGKLIPGGFGGQGEAIEELQLALDTVHKAIAVGIIEKRQHWLASRIYNALAEISLWYDDNEED